MRRDQRNRDEGLLSLQKMTCLKRLPEILLSEVKVIHKAQAYGPEQQKTSTMRSNIIEDKCPLGEKCEQTQTS